MNAFGAALTACCGLAYLSFWPPGIVAALWRGRRAKRGTVRLRLCVGASALGFLLSASFNAQAEVTPPAALTAYTLEGEAWQDLQSLNVLNALGNIEVLASEHSRAEITYRKLEPGAQLPGEPQLVVGEGGLELSLINPAWSSEQKQALAADIILYLTPDTELTIRLNSGDIRLENIRTVKLSADVGNIYVLGSEAADVQTYAGDVTLEQVTGIASVSSSAGSLSLDFAQPPSGPISAKTGSGDVSLSLPSGSDVSVIAVSKSRNLSGDFGEMLRPGEGRARLGQGWHEVSLSSDAGEVSFRLKGN